MAGSAPSTFDDIAKALSALTGQHVRYADTEPAAFAQRLRASRLPEFMVELTTGTALDVREYQYEVGGEDLARLLGREPAGLREALAEVFGLPN
jgi:NAD(P)H dehydrogenase (quinone)